MANVEDELRQRLSFLREKQKKYYYPGTDSDEEGLVESVYLHLKKVFPWASSCDASMVCTQTLNECSFEVCELADYLVNVRLEATLPPLKVKPALEEKVSVRWCRKPCIKIVNNVVIVVDGSLGPKMSKYSIDFHHETVTSKDKSEYELAKDLMGDVDHLQEFSDFHPETKISMDQPWEFAEGYHKSIPLFLCKESKIKFHYKFDLDITNMVQMRVVDSHGKYAYKKLDQRVLEDWCPKKLDTPALIGTYNMMTDEEKEFFIQTFKNKSCSQELESCYTIVKKQIKERLDPINLSISCPIPTTHLGFVSEDESAVEINDHFKTWKDNKGIYAPMKYTIDVGGLSSYPEDERMDQECYSRTAMKRQGMGNPPKGYSFIPFCRKVRNVNRDLALCIDEKSGTFLKIDFDNSRNFDGKNATGQKEEDLEKVLKVEDEDREEVVDLDPVSKNTKMWKLAILMYNKMEIVYDGTKAKIIKE